MIFPLEKVYKLKREVSAKQIFPLEKVYKSNYEIFKIKFPSEIFINNFNQKIKWLEMRKFPN